MRERLTTKLSAHFVLRSQEPGRYFVEAKADRDYIFSNWVDKAPIGLLELTTEEEAKDEANKLETEFRLYKLKKEVQTLEKNVKQSPSRHRRKFNRGWLGKLTGEDNW